MRGYQARSRTPARRHPVQSSEEQDFPARQLPLRPSAATVPMTEPPDIPTTDQPWPITQPAEARSVTKVTSDMDTTTSTATVHFTSHWCQSYRKDKLYSYPSGYFWEWDYRLARYVTTEYHDEGWTMWSIWWKTENEWDFTWYTLYTM